MKCTCGTSLPAPDDPTARSVTCPACGASVDIIVAAGDATQISAPSAGKRDPLLGRELSHGRYRIDSVLGEGGMGKVYLGTQVNLNRRVAIKVLSKGLTHDEQFILRFKREAGVLAALEHANIVSVFDVGEDDGLHYIVMAYVSGPDGAPTSLRHLMGGRPMEPEMSLRLIGQLCSALQYAHGRGIVHRDIKPGNILIDAEGNARMVDFGIARAGLAGEKTLTVPGTIMGSLRYMSPEQKLDSAKVDARSDLYSLGIVFYEMVTGAVPEGRFELPSRILDQIDARVDAIVDRVLQVVPEKRYQTAAELQEDVTRIVTDPGGATAPPAPSPAAKRSRRAPPKPRRAARQPTARGAGAEPIDDNGPSRPVLQDAATAAGLAIRRTFRKAADANEELPVWPKVVGAIGALAALTGLGLFIASLAEYSHWREYDYGYWYRGRLDRNRATAAGVLGMASVLLLFVSLFVGRGRTGRFHKGLAWLLAIGAAIGLVAMLGADDGDDTAEFFEVAAWPLLGLLILITPIWLANVREDQFVNPQPLPGRLVPLFALKNLAGVSMILASLILMVDDKRHWMWFVSLPVGLMATNLPGKRAMFLGLLRMGPIRAINRWRNSIGKQPLALP